MVTFELQKLYVHPSALRRGIGYRDLPKVCAIIIMSHYMFLSLMGCNSQNSILIVGLVPRKLL
jgi:hypothetical protein